MKDILLKAPDNQLDSSVKPLIEKWSSPAKAIEIFEVLDMCIKGSLASEVIVTMLQQMYSDALIAENISHNTVKLAVWRYKMVAENPDELQGSLELPEDPCELPTGSGLSWIRSDFFGAGTIDLQLKGKKVGRLTEGLYDDAVLWTAWDHRRTLENGSYPIVKVGNIFKASLLEASRALVNAILQ